MADPVQGPEGIVSTQPVEVVEHFFRHESGRLYGVLTRALGPGNLPLVEDVAQGALLQAMRTWAIGGIPANPSAWITRVAMNLARDAMRHRSMAFSKEDGIALHFEQTRSGEASHEDEFDDNTLRLLFVCCHPVLPKDAQAALALKVLCGFSTAEIAAAFLGTEAAMEKQLTRTKQKIRDEGVGFVIPEGGELAERLDGVLATLYLLFNEGYKASEGDRLVREDLCAEAIRLGLLLAAHPAGDTPRCHALLALMLLNAARFPARLDADGRLLRLEDQDRSRWDKELIGRGLTHLARAADGEEMSEYHLQAAIAASHCTAKDYASTDWARIVRYYDQLAAIRLSPVVLLNRAVAVANLRGAQAGLDAIGSIPDRKPLESRYIYHAVVGELYWRLKNKKAAADSISRAVDLSQVGPERSHLERRLREVS